MTELKSMKLAELHKLASSRGLKGTSKMRKSELIDALAAQGGAPRPAQAASERKARAPKASADERPGSPADAQPQPADSPRREDRSAAEDERAEAPRKSRRRRAVIETKEPSALAIDLPEPVGSSERPAAQQAQAPVKELGAIELPEGDDSEDRGRNRRDRNSRRRNRDRPDRQDRSERNGRNNRRDRYRDERPDRADRDEAVREDEQLAPIAGILDVQDNHAFVRTSGYLPGPNDVYVTLGNVRRWGLRPGDAVAGAVRQPREGERQRQKYNALVRVDSVNGMSIEDAQARREFGKLTPIYPSEQLRLETSAKAYTPRVIDLVAPIGKGQRGLIVSPPKAGKTMVIQQIAKAIELNNPEVHLMVVLVDERPEEVTDMRSIVKGEVIASTFDRPASDHTIVAELAIERAKRLVELGQDVVVLLDSLTRLSRAYNLAAPASGRILSGGVDASALYPPKKFFGGARNLKEGGSLTIIASALVETGSKMDEVIFEEFKGTGNMELRLSRQLADRRIFPAIDVNASGTRREEMLFGPEELRIMWKLRRVLGTLDQQSALELILEKLKDTQSNAEFLMLVQKTTPSVD
ncbi:transcription termination factor Rho [Schaalia hyovaginalis]|uniref:Transcription termination factor Rho n=1 Tax=Schaalia hyovaginalis TaxID=29316 RepID=A0A923E5X3_9ACTO|nr:transcription termination factor Rho [Schaalia hyovaginalis]MBB6334947.1 transcription termination factor Rho [Schaalia hyovaginalis]MDY2669440.1 transcription termination factor Rho [Schaalia hyovaginalis]